MAHYRFCHSTILQFLTADISLNITLKELEIAYILRLKISLNF